MYALADRYIKENVFNCIMNESERAIRSWNPWWMKGWDPPRTVPRGSRDKILDVLGARHIKDIIGVRRCGKTTLLYQIIFHLIQDGTSPEKIIFLNFDDITINTLSFQELMKAIFRLRPGAEYLFLDEVQEKSGWERWIRQIYDQDRFKQIFVTGSNASLLSEDMGRVLTGRHMSFELLPFSFRKFLYSSGWTESESEYARHHQEELYSHFDRYLLKGGFPEAVDLDDNSMTRMLVSIFNDILARDVGEKHSVDGEKLRNLSKYLFTNVSNSYSNRGVATTVGLNYDTVERYMGYLKDAFMVFDLKMFSYGLKKQYRQNKKIYVIDNGLRNHVSFRFSADNGRLAENLVFLELRRREADVYYWRNDRREVDFLVCEGLDVSELIQVCWDVRKKSTRQREEAGLMAACRNLDKKEGLILTRDRTDEQTVDGITIRYRPIPYWLLGIEEL